MQSRWEPWELPTTVYDRMFNVILSLCPLDISSNSCLSPGCDAKDISRDFSDGPLVKILCSQCGGHEFNSQSGN